MQPLQPLLPNNVDWPTERWQRRNDGRLENSQASAAIEYLFAGLDAGDVTYALLIAQRGELLFERYDAGATAFYLQYSWSMAKSITHALVGMLVGDGKLHLEQKIDAPEWQADARAEITLAQLLAMRSGLEFSEDYEDGGSSDVIAMLNTTGRHDMANYAAAKPLQHAPGTHWSYSSGTTNIICRLLRETIGGPTEFLRFASQRLFEPIGMRSATPRFDHSGTFIGSSFLFATPQDFLRFGLLYLRDGCWDGQRLLPPSWVDQARTPTYNDGTEAYGAHWWLSPTSDRFFASGYDGQRIIIDPTSDTVLVRLGRTPVHRADPVWSACDTLITTLT
ncbi:MAG: serine hydrolase domain-containing protein [Pseudomonadales bacterium]